MLRLPPRIHIRYAADILSAEKSPTADNLVLPNLDLPGARLEPGDDCPVILDPRRREEVYLGFIDRRDSGDVVMQEESSDKDSEAAARNNGVSMVLFVCPFAMSSPLATDRRRQGCSFAVNPVSSELLLNPHCH